MSRRIVLVVAIAFLVAVGGVVALVVTARPELRDRRDAVDARWAPLRAPLAARYDRLAQVADALSAAGAGSRTYAVDLADELTRWDQVSKEADPAAEAAVANRLEGSADRARTNVAASARLGRDPAVADAFAAFDAALVPPDAVAAYNRAVRRYQHTRTDLRHRIPADLLGYEPRPVLVVGGGAPDADA